jgi:hemerythrin-like domain-containing protein
MNSTFARQTSRMLNDEHEASLSLLGRAERVLAQIRPGTVPPVDAALRGLLSDLKSHLAHEVDVHFRFEESTIFPLLEDAGEGDITGLLRDEHDTIRSVAAELGPLCAAALDGSLDGEGWSRLSRLALETVERQVDHIQKETAGLLPMIDDLLDDERDRQLALEHAQR